MSKPKSIASILASPTLLAERQKAQRYVKHEFQDYAYRLAADLGDTKHKGIYMKLAKTVDRYLLDQAAAFALGYMDEVNKGKLFMWRLAQLRQERQLKLDLQNFDPAFVVKKMQETVKAIPQIFSARQQKDVDEVMLEDLQLFKELVKELPLKPRQKAAQVLVAGVGAGWEAALLQGAGFQVTGIEHCRELLAIAKKKLKQAKLTARRDLLPGKLKPAGFSGIWLRCWGQLPLESEESCLQEYLKLLTPGGYIYLPLGINSKATQTWEEFSWKEKNYIRFVKHNTLTSVRKMLKDNGLKIVKESERGVLAHLPE